LEKWLEAPSNGVAKRQETIVEEEYVKKWHFGKI
jgi:hypothetical protein